MVSRFNPAFVDTLPFVQFFYRLGNTILYCVESEKDLGIVLNRTLNFTEHASNLYNQANKRFGLIKRTCHFVQQSYKKRLFYLT